MDFIGKGIYVDMISFMLIGLRLWLNYLINLTVFSLNLENRKIFKLLNFSILIFLVLTFLTRNILLFYVFFEIVLIPIIIIIFIWGNQPERLLRRIYIFLYTLLGSLPLLIIIVNLRDNLSLNYFFIYLGIEKNYIRIWSFLFLNIAFLIKFPIYGFHLWLPKAHVEAPIFGSIILAGVLLKLGGYGIYRFIIFYQYIINYIINVILTIALIGGVFRSWICLRQIDIKILIAYSSVVHIRFIIVSEYSINYLGSWGRLMIIIGHGLCSSGLFCLSNLIYERFYTRNLFLLKGLNNIFPSLVLLWFLLIVINIGCPPFINLFGEVLLIGRILKYRIIFVIPLVLISFFRACYSLYLYSFSQHGKIWFLYRIEMISFREYILIFLHFFPLGVFLFKIEIFYLWVGYLSSLIKIINCGFIDGVLK